MTQTEKIQTALKAAGVEKDELVSETGLPLDRLDAILNGNSPTAAEIRKLAQTLGTTIKELEDEETYGELRDVEIFRSGVWNGDRYTDADLDDIVRAFDRVGFKPPLKLGHAEKSGSPAAGWIQSIKRVGSKLVADITDIPDQVFNAIKDKRFGPVSSEIFWNLKRGGETFRRALKAVAILGSEIPAVSNLKPLYDSFCQADSVRIYQLTDEGDPMPDDKVTKEDLENQLKEMKDELTKRDDQIAALAEQRRKDTVKSKVDELRVPAYRHLFTGLYELATKDEETKIKVHVAEDKDEELSAVEILDRVVEKLNRDTEKLFEELSTAGDLGRDDREAEEDGKRPDVIVDERTRKLMADEKIEDYGEALRKVLEADPELAEKYTNA